MIRGDVFKIKFKEPDKTRPALILTRTEAVAELNTVTIIPITSTIRDIDSQVFLDKSDGMDKECVVNVDNIQTVSKQRIGAYVTHLSNERMNDVFEAIKFAFGFDK
jgi:mRNA interferase MazF